MAAMKKLMGLLVMAGVLATCDEGNDGPLDSGMPAPAFSTPHLDGRSLAFPADFSGRPVVLRFWADWCLYCREEMISMEPTYRDHRKEGLAVLAVNVGQSRETAADFVRNLGISYDVLLDEGAVVAHLYRVTGLPTTYFIDRQGIVRGKILGEIEARVFRDFISRVM